MDPCTKVISNNQFFQEKIHIFQKILIFIKIIAICEYAFVLIL